MKRTNKTKEKLFLEQSSPLQVTCKEFLNSKILTTQNLYDILQNIKMGKYKGIIDKLRNSPNKEMHTKNKQNLPVFYLSGVFHKRTIDTNFVSNTYTNLLQIDIDYKQNQNVDLGSLRKELVLLPFVLSVFTSSSGNGLKVIVAHNLSVDENLKAFNFFEKYFLKTYQVKINNLCKNISSVFYVSNDENLYLSSFCNVLDLRENNIIADLPNEPIEHYSNTKFDNVFDFCVYSIEKITNFTEEKKSVYRMMLAKLLSIYGVSDNKIIQYLTQNYPSITGITNTIEDIKLGIKYAQNKPKRTFKVKQTKTENTKTMNKTKEISKRYGVPTPETCKKLNWQTETIYIWYIDLGSDTLVLCNEDDCSLGLSWFAYAPQIQEIAPLLNTHNFKIKDYHYAEAYALAYIKQNKQNNEKRIS